MLTITIPDLEFYSDKDNEFMTIKGQSLVLEHSLVSLSKWESKWHKPFLSKETKTPEEMADYIRCMTLTQNVNPYVYKAIPQSELEKISEYINDPMTATWFSNANGNGKPGGRQVITSELIYFWMISQQIPFECQKWHLNRLMTLIRVCAEKNTPPKKMSKKDIMAKNRSLNASRKAALHSKG